MHHYLFTNVIGSFVFNEKFDVVEMISFTGAKDHKKKEAVEKRLTKKHGITDTALRHTRKILEYFKENDYFHAFYEKNLELTKRDIKGAVTNDVLIIQTISALEELDKVKNILIKRLREWYELYLPELSHKIEDQEQFVKHVIDSDKKQLIKKYKIHESMGADLEEKDLQPMLSMASEIARTFDLRKKYEKYLDALTQETCPNVREIAGILIAAKLLSHAGSLRRLATFPASTVQILGAEKALFRHMKSKRHKPPKYGILHEHYLISRAKRSMHGKIARALADKISIAARVDYFKGEFIGDTFRKELEEKFEI